MNFSEELRRLVPSPCCNRRPFTCRGSLLDCTVIIIGKNPARRLNVDWWGFFGDDLNFDYAAFQTCYQAQGGPSQSPTRHRFNYLQTSGLRCVETNVYADEGPRGYVPTVLQLDVLQLLIDGLPHLEAVIGHGKEAREIVPSLRLPYGVLLFETEHFYNAPFKQRGSKLANVVAEIERRRRHACRLA